MKTFVVGYLSALAALAVLDVVWIGLISREFYKARLGHFLLDQPIWLAAILFYLIHAAGISVFTLPPALASGSWVTAMLYGGFFGLCVFAAYDLTNLATLRGWPISVTLVDLAWGTLMTATAATVAFRVVRAVSTS